MNYFDKVFGYSICWCSYGWHNSSHVVFLPQFMSFYSTRQSWWYRIWQIYLEIFSICKLFSLFLVGVRFSGFCWWTSMLGHFLLFSLYLAVPQFLVQRFFLTILQILNPYRIDKFLCLCCSLFVLMPFFVILRDCPEALCSDFY